MGEPEVIRPAETPSPEVTNDDRLMAALAWLSMVILQIPIISVLILLVESNKSRPLQRFHAVNSILLWVAGFVYEILAVVVYLFFTFISFGCLGLFLWVIFFAPHVIGLYYAYQAYHGSFAEVPVLTQWARDQGWV